MTFENRGRLHGEGRLGARRTRRGIGLLTTTTAFVMCLAAGPAAACTIPTSLGVAFSIDDSGSMNTSDPDRLRSAATGAGIDQLPDGAYTAVSSFDSAARSLVDPVAVTATNRSALKTDLDNGLYASGETHYDLAFSRAKQQLDNMPGTDKRALVFLSDGAPNGGGYSDELDTVRSAGIPVFAIGFGSAPGSVLAQIAASTGGQAYTIQSPGEAQAVFARIVSTLTCDASQVQESVTLSPGETRGFPYTIGPSDREYRALAAWSFAGVTVRLRRPDGSFLTPGAELAGERFISEETYASVIGRNPAVGGWELQVTSAADNVDQVDVTIDIFRRTSADPPDTFALTAPAAGAQIPLGTPTFQWVGARNAESYELEIDDRVVASGLPRDATSASVNLLGAAGPHTWRVAAVNRFGRTLSDRRPFTRTGYKYVALGDSFSAGEGVEEFFEPSNRCHRSRLAYATRVERPVTAGSKRQSIYAVRSRPEIEWGFQACSGAETLNVTETAHEGDPLAQLARDRGSDTPQINANDLPVDENTDLITITVGGNDLGFEDILKFCATSANCTTQVYNKVCGGKRSVLATYLRCKRGELSPKLDAVYAQIRRQAPEARILVLGYPQLFPRLEEEQECGKLIQRNVRSGSLGFSKTEQNHLRQGTSEANQLIAARAAASGVAEFVAVDSYFDRHEVCGNGKEWINAWTPSVWTPVTNQQSFHPNEKGHEYGYAVAVNDALNPGPPASLRFASAAPATVRPNAAGSVRLPGREVSCPSGTTTCIVTTDARAHLLRRKASVAAIKARRIGGSRFYVQAKRSKTVRFALTRSALVALKRRGRVRSTIRVVVQHGNRRSARSVTVTLVEPKPQSRSA